MSTANSIYIAILALNWQIRATQNSGPRRIDMPDLAIDTRRALDLRIVVSNLGNRHARFTQ